MFNWFRRKKSPERCVEEIVNKYFDSPQGMSDEDYSKLKDCLENWNEHNNPMYLGAMAYVRYREGALNKMWDYIEKDLHLDLGDEEHGAFIPAMFADVDPKLRYEILLKIHRHLNSPLALEIMARLAEEVGKRDETITLLKDYLDRNPGDRKIRKVLEELEG